MCQPKKRISPLFFTSYDKVHEYFFLTVTLETGMLFTNDRNTSPCNVMKTKPYFDHNARMMIPYTLCFRVFFCSFSDILYINIFFFKPNRTKFFNPNNLCME